MQALAFCEVSNSKFYGYIFDIDSYKEFETILNKIKKEHKHATHFVYAYQINENDKFILKRNDDIEPKGYGTNAMINLINKHNLKQICFIVVRYFGGKKLGGSKLINTYSKVINIAYTNYINQ